MEITQLRPEHIDYVVNIIMDRWDDSKETALLEIERWLANKDNSICFVGIIDGKPMATGVFETFSTVDESIPCWNTLLWVEPKHRGNDYGKMMTEKRFEYAQRLGFKTIYLDTVNAKDYHLKCGWETIRTFDKNNEHYTIMKYDFNETVTELQEVIITHRDSCKTYPLKRIGLSHLLNTTMDTPTIKELYESDKFKKLQEPEIGCLLIWTHKNNYATEGYWQPHGITKDGKIFCVKDLITDILQYMKTTVLFLMLVGKKVRELLFVYVNIQ